ncbi:MAG: insulinase family protein [Acidimicrobiia bacterium]|nr:insulinase family protein [Acidimicrobiia bacterium]
MIERTTLDSGVRVVTERMPTLRSVALGVWVGTGSRDESPDLAGASHFLEHMLFKGTERWSARGIAEAVEAVGGDMNAFTTHEYTAFYVRVPDEEFDLAADILSDIIREPSFRTEEVDAERQVILEEIRMRDDAPDDVAHETFGAALFPKHPIGREVIGSHETVGDLSRDDIAGYHREHYRSRNLVVAAAGNVDHAQVVERLGALLVEGDAGDRPARPRPEIGSPLPVAVQKRPTEQAHVVLGVRSLPRADDARWALGAVNQVLGGGMASRLFQEVRELRGLAYSVYSYRAAFEETGAFGIYVGTGPERVGEALAVIDEQIERLRRDGGVSAEELRAAQGHLVGSLSLSLETAASRMHRIGSSELTLGEVLTVDEVVDKMRSVTPDDVGAVVERLFTDSAMVLAAVGPFDESAFADRITT